MNILSNVIVVSLVFHIWSGRKKLRPEDLMASGASLPPEELVSLGSKKIFDPEVLKVFYELKRKAEGICASKGVRFLKGYAVPKSEAQEVLRKLDAVLVEFDQKKTRLLAEYDDLRRRWMNQHSTYAHIIKEMMSREEVSRRIAGHYELFEVGEVSPEVAAAGAKAQANLGAGLGARLFEEVSAQARELVKRSLEGRTEVTQKFLRPLRAIRAKMMALQFVDGRVGPIIDEMDKVLAAMPKEGKITGIDLAALRGVCGLLSDPLGMRRHGELALTPSLFDESEADDEEESEKTLPEEPEDDVDEDVAEQVRRPVGQQSPAFSVLL
jgi:hypothetical protein